MEILNAAEVRVLGSLLEKDIATPEYYPLTVNALIGPHLWREVSHAPNNFFINPRQRTEIM